MGSSTSSRFSGHHYRHVEGEAAQFTGKVVIVGDAASSSLPPPQAASVNTSQVASKSLFIVISSRGECNRCRAHLATIAGPSIDQTGHR